MAVQTKAVASALAALACDAGSGLTFLGALIVVLLAAARGAAWVAADERPLSISPTPICARSPCDAGLCSRLAMRSSSPPRRCWRRQDCDTLLIASVAPRTKTTSES